jgi:hypothetical protein
MSAAINNLNIEKGVDFSLPLILQRSNGDYIDLSDSGVCVKADIVEFYGLPPITGFTISENLPSGVLMTLSEEGTRILPYNGCSYDIVSNVSGDSERLMQGFIETSEQATTNISCP